MTRKQKDNITFEEFEKLDIRMCRIISCGKVPDTDKLYQMEVDTGSEELGIKLVVSSIADKITPEELIGFNYPFIVNLPPRKIRGISSEAMIILGERKDGGFVKLTTLGVEDIGSIII